MGTHEQAEGSWRIPTKELPKVKQALVAAWNAEITRQYELALKLYNQVVAAGKGKRKFDYRRAFAEAWDWEIRTPERQRAPFSSLGRGRVGPPPWFPGDDARGRAMHAMFLDPQTRRMRDKPVKPKKKDFPLANGQTTRFDALDFLIWIDPQQRIVGWSVPDNKSAVQRAYEHPLSRELFQILDQVAWTRGSGGSVRYRCEYDWDSSLRHGYGPTREVKPPAAE